MTLNFSPVVKRVASARSLRVRVLDDATVVVTAPPRVPDYQISDFINQHIDWITERQKIAKQKLQALTEQRSILLFRGQEYQFRLAVQASKKAGITLEKSQLIVTAPTEDHQAIRTLLEAWYKKQAKKYFSARVPLLADLVNRDVDTVTIRSQRSRWGSCSSRNTISLNWRLIQTPDWVSDYVIYHELAHLTQMNHSKKFWQLVESYFPRYQAAETWLKKHHGLLQF